MRSCAKNSQSKKRNRQRRMQQVHHDRRALAIGTRRAWGQTLHPPRSGNASHEPRHQLHARSDCRLWSDRDVQGRSGRLCPTLVADLSWSVWHPLPARCFAAAAAFIALQPVLPAHHYTRVPSRFPSPMNLFLFGEASKCGDKVAADKTFEDPDLLYKFDESAGYERKTGWRSASGHRSARKS